MLDLMLQFLYSVVRWATQTFSEINLLLFICVKDLSLNTLITAPSFVVEKRGHMVKVVQALSWEGESETGEELNPVQ